ncbi:MAG: ATP-binding protein [Myxococcales bacterium]|nr:ATP-binding protein [Myxococcales bacterium]
MDLAEAGLPDRIDRPILFTGSSPWALETLSRVLAAHHRRPLWICTRPGEAATDPAPLLAWTRLLRDAALAGALVACDLVPERAPEPMAVGRRAGVAVAAARRVGAPLLLFAPAPDHLSGFGTRDLHVLPVSTLPLRAGAVLAEARLRQEGVLEAAAITERAIVPLAISVGHVEAVLDAHRRGILESDAPSARSELADALRPRLGNLVERIARRASWEALVLPEETHVRLREVVLYRRHADHVYRTWGLGRHIAGEGVAALFTGPPGTGKSLAATVIATEPGIALYRVDLSRIVSKWVGETEKNLGQLFAESRSGRAVLLFDEADSLFGKRTEVRSSNDRYANLEVNFLLQHLDEFDGIAILTSNSPNAIDPAFMRRLQFRVHFEIPDASARLALWMHPLPSPEHICEDVNLDEISETYVFSGGNIRNAAIRAAFLAAEDGGSIEQRHVLAACITETEELGHVVKRE